MFRPPTVEEIETVTIEPTTMKGIMKELKEKNMSPVERIKYLEGDLKNEDGSEPLGDDDNEMQELKEFFEKLAAARNAVSLEAAVDNAIGFIQDPGGTTVPHSKEAHGGIGNGQFIDSLHKMLNSDKYLKQPSVAEAAKILASQLEAFKAQPQDVQEDILRKKFGDALHEGWIEKAFTNAEGKRALGRQDLDDL